MERCVLLLFSLCNNLCLTSDINLQTRWGGGLANTRGFGDAHYKALGVFAEPAISSHIYNGAECAFLLLMSDGVTDMLSDQEIADLARREKNPGNAAKAVVQFAESIGGCVLGSFWPFSVYYD